MKKLIEDLEQLAEGLKIDLADKKVIKAFTEKKKAEGKKLSTDGTKLDGNWMGGNNIAEWKSGKIHFNDLGSKAADTVQKAVRKEAPKNWIAEEVLTEKRGRIFMAPRRDSDYQDIFDYVDESLGDCMVALDKAAGQLSTSIGELETLVGGLAGKPEKSGNKALKAFEAQEKVLNKVISGVYTARSEFYKAEREFKE